MLRNDWRARNGFARFIALGGLAMLAWPAAGAQPRPDSIARSMTGPVRMGERPASVSQLLISPGNSAMPVENLSQLLSGRFAGVQVLSGGATGTGSRIRIRGQSSLRLGNEPLIVLDGVRLIQTHNPSTQLPSLVDDINVDEIERVEIINGPSGTTMYGGEAAHGVINIVTRRGVAGRVRLNAYTEHGLSDDANTYPDVWARWGKRPGATLSSPCLTTSASAGPCVTDSLSRGNVMHVDSLTPVAWGYRSQYGAQVSGGTKRVQFLVAGEREDETGVFRMPERDQRRLELTRGVQRLPEHQVRPSALARNSIRANVSTQLGSMLSLDVSTAYVKTDTRLPPMSGTSVGLGVAATGWPWVQTLTDDNGVPLAGYGFYSAGELMSQTTPHANERVIGGASAQFKPSRWFLTRAVYGLDQSKQMLGTYQLKGEGPENFPSTVDFLNRADVRSMQQTVDAQTVLSFQPFSWLASKSTFGYQHIGNRDSVMRYSGSSVRGHPTTPDRSGSHSSAASWGRARTSGFYVEQVLSVDSKLFVTGGVRRDELTRNNIRQQFTLYPSVGASWLLSEHGFLQGTDAVNVLRVRAAFGTAGQMGLPSEQIDFGLLNFGSVFGPLPPGLGPKPKPEYSREWESGVDMVLFRDATNMSVSYYQKKTSNVYVPALEPGSIGGGQLSYYVNGASVSNSGLEVTLQQRLVSRRSIAADVRVVAATNRNRLTSVAPGIPPVFSGNRFVMRSSVGLPLYALRSRTYTYDDRNADGILTSDEMSYSDSAAYLGSSFPQHTLALTPSVALFNHRLKLSAQIDSKWGFRKFNNTLRQQCQSQACRAVNDVNAPLELQAAALAAGTPFFQRGGFFEDASFTRVREAAIAYELPARWVRAIGGTALNVALTGRNLGVFTSYSGVDPESVVGTNDVDIDEYFGTPPMRLFTLRLNVRW